MTNQRKITWVCLIVAGAGIEVLSWYPAAVEKYYSRGFYPVVSRFQRLLFGWIPFSVGDVLYAAAAAVLLWRLVRGIRRLVRREAARGWLLRLVRQVVFVLLWVYVVFNVAWGLNYNRLGIADQLQLQVKPYSTSDLDTLTELALSELSRLDSPARMNRADLARLSVLRAGACKAYDSLAASDPRFAYRNVSVKSSLFRYPGLYIGFAGYYDPFTGEAQVNTLDPLFTQPYTMCHEMGHQLGYAKENEANFMGFLAAKSSRDPAFGYSAFLDLYLYAWPELYIRDSTLAKNFKSRLPAGVKADIREEQRFNRRYQSTFERAIWDMYGGYLRANRQPHGIVTYSEVTAWLIAYAKKYGWNILKA